MGSQDELSPAAILQVMTGSWASGVLGAAAAHSVFTHIEKGAHTMPALASAAAISTRGAQALLDGLVGLGLLRVVAPGRYGNSPEASAFLVEGKPAYLGAMARLLSQEMASWGSLAEVVRTGASQEPVNVEESEYWDKLVTAIAPLSFPVAKIAAQRLGLARAGAVSWLDVGGGSGVYSAIWLGECPQASATQLDWPNVNRIARAFVARFGVGERFRTIDGDFHTTDFGEHLHDYAIFSHIAHQETPAANVELFRRLRRALKSGGTLVISDFVLEDDRTGHPFALLFNSNMLRVTKEGATYRVADYRAWLTEAGFGRVTIEPTPTPATLVFAT